MRTGRALGALLIVFLFPVLLVLPAAVSARSVGISAGASMVYTYTIHTTYATPNGNHTQDQHNEFTLKILSVEPQATLGEVTYTETVTLLNDSSMTTTQAVENVTTIFDPYNNDTYLGNIGFNPFVYTDLSSGTADGLRVSFTVTGTPSGSLSGTQTVNATVARSPGEIDVNYTLFSAPDVPPSQAVLVYNSTTGLLTHGVTYTHFFEIEKDFIYNLVSYAPATSGTSGYPAYIVPLIAVAAVVVIAVVAIVRRPSARERRAERLRHKMGRSA